MQVYKFIVPEVIFGRGALGEVGEATRRLGAARVLVVCDAGVVASGWLDKLLPYLEEQKLSYAVWSGFTSNPKDVEIEAGTQLYAEQSCDAIVGLGGGSCIDAAKAIAVLSSNGGKLREYEGIDKIKRPLPPMVMVPTTAGSASDVSQFAAINDTARQAEMTLISRSLSPDISITDPLLLTTLDSWRTAVTGMDVLTHGIEAYLSRAATFLTDQHAREAIKLVFQYLRGAVEHPQDLTMQEGMARASLHAGLASSNAILGATHAMANQVGGLLNQVHGEVNGILLPYVMEFNLPLCVERVASIAEMIGINVAGLPPGEAAQAAIAAVRELAYDIGLTRRLGELGVTEEVIPLLGQRAVTDACMVTNPRSAAAHELASLFRAAL